MQVKDHKILYFFFRFKVKQQGKFINNYYNTSLQCLSSKQEYGSNIQKKIEKLLKINCKMYICFDIFVHLVAKGLQKFVIMMISLSSI